jgi:hypothetical protein
MDKVVQPLDYNLLEEINMGDTRLRLCSTMKENTTYIQLWSSLSDKWSTMHRYNVDEQWESWKKYAVLHFKE